MKNIVVYNMPEGTSTLKVENATHDRELMKQLPEHTTDGQYQSESLQVQRLGSKHKHRDWDRRGKKSTPACDLSRKASVMKNLQKLKTKTISKKWS